MTNIWARRIRTAAAAALLLAAAVACGSETVGGGTHSADGSRALVYRLGQ